MTAGHLAFHCLKMILLMSGAINFDYRDLCCKAIMIIR